MTERTLIFELADNGMVVRDDEFVTVCENTHDKDSNSTDNLAHCLGMMAYAELMAAMEEFVSVKIRVTVKIDKVI